MTKDDIASAITPIIRAGFAAGAGFLAARGFTGATDLVSSFTAAGVTLVATAAWALVEKNKLVAAAFGQLPISSLEKVATTVAELRRNGGDPLLVAHIAQAVTALANQELAAAQPHMVPVAPVAPAAEAPPAVQETVPVAPPPAPLSPEPAPAVPAAPVLADGSLPQ